MSTFAAIVLVIAGYGLARVLAAVWWRMAIDRRTGLTHFVMGLGMAGMLVDGLDPFPDSFWIAVFAIVTVLYAVVLVRRYRGLSILDDRSRHDVPHFVESLAMLYMYTAIPPGHTEMVMPAEGSARWPAVAFVFALLIFGHAVWTAIALTPLVLEPVVAPEGPAPEPAEVAPGLNTVDGGAVATEVSRRSAVATMPMPGRWGLGGPYLSEFCEIAMGVVMSYTLLLLL
jgi:hypothetical protein